MTAAGANLVAGLFRSRSQAEVAVRDLYRLGLTDADVEIGAPEPGRYRLEYRESQDIGRGILVGGAAGAPIGAVLGIGFLMASVPGMALGVTLGLGVAIGAFWGIFFGALAGMVLKAMAYQEGHSRYAIAAGSSEVLVIAHAGDQFWAARQAMRNDGARVFFADVPAVQPSHAGLAVAG